MLGYLAYTCPAAAVKSGMCIRAPASYAEVAPDVGQKPRYRPAKLAAKLRRIREALGLSQAGMLELLALPAEITQTNISRYERGAFDPPLNALLRYADVANVWLDVLVRDELELPARLPSPVKHEGIKTRPAASPSKSPRQATKPRSQQT